MRESNIIFSFLLITIISCDKYHTEPLSLVQTIFQPDYVVNRNHFTAEYNGGSLEWYGYPNGATLPAKSTTNFLLLKPLSSYDTTAVVNVTIVDSIGKASDIYVHLVKDSIWRATALESLNYKDWIYQEQKDLERLTGVQIDSIIKVANNTSMTNCLFNSREEYNFKLKNTELILSSDNEIIAHFNANRKKFESLKLNFGANYASKRGGSYDIEEDEQLLVQMKDLLLSDIKVSHRYKSSYNIQFEIGGKYRSKVGYLYAGELWAVPEMTSDKLIMLRQIKDNWFLYKINGE